MSRAGWAARGFVHAWIRVCLKATLTLLVLAATACWIALLWPLGHVLGGAGAAAWLAVTFVFVGLMGRELRLRRRDGGIY